MVDIAECGCEIPDKAELRDRLRELCKDKEITSELKEAIYRECRIWQLEREFFLTRETAEQVFDQKQYSGGFDR